MKKRITLILLSFISLSSLIGCSNQEKPKEDDPNKKEWTIMSYIVASNLEGDYGSYTNKLLNFVNKVTPSDKVNYVFQIGGTNKYEPTNTEKIPGAEFDVTKCQRYTYKEKGKFQKVYESSIVNMSSPTSLSNFIKWTVTNYPAKHYMIELLDHGGGAYYGYGLDIPFSSSAKGDNRAIMTLDNMESAFQTANVQFDIINFDCCLMSCVEATQTVGNYAKYMLANEESSASIVDTIGTRIQYVIDHYQDDAKSIALAIAKTIHEEENKTFLKDRAINAALDLSYVNELTTTFNNFWLTARKNLSNNDAQKALADALYLCDRMIGNYSYDLYSLLNPLLNNAAFKESATALKETINKMVMYKGLPERRSGVSGLAFCYKTDYSAIQLDHLLRGEGHNYQYLAYLDDTHNFWNAPSYIYNYVERTPETDLSENIITIDVDSSNFSTTGEATFKIKSGLSKIYRIEGLLVKQVYTKTDKNYYYLGKDSEVEFNIATGEGKFKKPLSWGHLFSATKEGVQDKVPLYQNITSSNASETLYSIPLSMTFSDTKGFSSTASTAITTLDNKSLDFTIHGVMNFYDAYNLLPDGDYHAWPEPFSESKGRIRTRYAKFGEYGKYGEYSSMCTTISYDKTTSIYFDYALLDAGNYSYSYVITDIYGNEFVSQDLYNFTIA